MIAFPDNDGWRIPSGGFRRRLFILQICDLQLAGDHRPVKGKFGPGQRCGGGHLFPLGNKPVWMEEILLSDEGIIRRRRFCRFVRTRRHPRRCIAWGRHLYGYRGRQKRIQEIVEDSDGNCRHQKIQEIKALQKETS
jgi:hypothetical protein